jgi:hypothetical protein
MMEYGDKREREREIVREREARERVRERVSERKREYASGRVGENERSERE